MAHGAENRRTPEAALHLSTSPFGMTVPVSGIAVKKKKKKHRGKSGWALIG